MNNLKSKIISLSGSWRARAFVENDSLFEETANVLLELAETMEDEKPVTQNNSPYPDDYYHYKNLDSATPGNQIIKWIGYPCGAIKNSSVKHEMVDEDGNRIVTSFSGENYNVHPAVRECELNDGSSYYIREGCFPIRWEDLS